MSKKSVSCVIPIYNAAKYLSEAIESVRCQTYRNFELILVDDGSKDASLEIAKGHAAVDPRIKVISRPNTGIVGALNDGLSVANGQFIACMHADDISFLDRFRQQVDFLEQHPECVGVGSAILKVDPAGAPLGVQQWTCSPKKIHDELLLGRGGLAHPAAMIRSSSLSRVGGYRAEFELVEDKDLWLRLDEVGELANLETPLLAYRRHMETLSRRYRSRVRTQLIAVLEDAYQRRGRSAPLPSHIGRVSPQTPQRELSAWVRESVSNGFLQTGRQHLVQMVREHPFNFRTWRTALAYGCSATRYRFGSLFSDAVPNPQLADALSRYSDVKTAISQLDSKLAAA